MNFIYYEMEQIRLNNKDIFKEIFDKSPIGILFYDKKGKLTDTNMSAQKITGVQKLEDIVGSDIFNNPDISSKRQN